MKVSELLAMEGKDFLDIAYKSILNREIDYNGEAHYLRRLRVGDRKYDVIRSLKRSNEGKSAKAKIDGMRKYLLRHWLTDLPIIGWVVSRLYNVETNDPISRQIRVLKAQLILGGTKLDRQNQQIPEHHSANFSSFWDVTRQDNISSETVALYALLKSPK